MEFCWHLDTYVAVLHKLYERPKLIILAVLKIENIWFGDSGTLGYLSICQKGLFMV